MFGATFINIIQKILDENLCLLGQNQWFYTPTTSLLARPTSPLKIQWIVRGFNNKVTAV